MSTGPTSTNPQVQAFQRAFNSLSRGRQIAIVAAVLGLISTFLRWYSVSVGVGSYSVSASINGWHGWGFLALLGYLVAGIVVLLPLAQRSVRTLIPSLPPDVTEARVVLGAGLAALLGTILFMATEGGGSVSGPGYSAGPSYGAYIGLLCAIAIAVGGYLMQQEPATV
jgi:hypothetical protein